MISFFFPQGLEHLMYSLGLGHIEFDPTHTIEQHRPPGYKQSKPIINNTKIIPDVDALSDRQLSIRAELEKNLLGYTLDENQTVEFREMHDPKHRHPRQSNGKSAQL